MGMVSCMPPIKRPLPLDNPITSETKPETDEDSYVALVSLQCFLSCLISIAITHCQYTIQAAVKCAKLDKI